jgi:hypothetical protein
MAEIALIGPLDETAALDWLRSQPGGRINLPAAELGRRWGWQRQGTGRRLEAWAKAGHVTRHGNIITVADGSVTPPKTVARPSHTSARDGSHTVGRPRPCSLSRGCRPRCGRGLVLRPRHGGAVPGRAALHGGNGGRDGKPRN